MRTTGRAAAVGAVILYCGLLAVIAVGASPSAAPAEMAEYFTLLAPEPIFPKTSKEIVDHLVHDHYRALPIDDTLSAKVLDRYLDDLDHNRIYFLAADIQEFQAHRLQLDNALLAGDLQPAYLIYNRFQQRVMERLVFQLRLLEQGLSGMNFDVDESMAADREKAPWPASAAEMDDLWRKRLKGTALSLKLTGKNLEEISKTLTRRFRNQLNQFRQARSEDAFQAYMNAVTRSFDPHTQYFSPQRSENFDISMSLSFEGIGAILQTEEEYVKIVRLVPAGPAEKSKQLRPDDRIVGVGQGSDGEMVDVIGWRIDEVVQLIRGPKDTTIRLEVIPADAEDDHATRVVRLVRSQIKLEEQAARKKIIELEYQGRPRKIGVIDIPTFYMDFRAQRAGEAGYRSTTDDVRRLLAELVAERVDGVIIDLRDNSGGSLQEANSLTGLFIDRGPTVQIRDARGRVEIQEDTDPAIVYKGPLAVLVNRLSASASEIFAGAIQDYQRGLIIGEDTFGKGTVQTLVTLEHGQLKNTAAKFYRISGESTQHKGVTPDLLYPSLYDKEKLGESALEEALPWDTIRPQRHRGYFELSPLLSQLRARHDERLAADPEYKYVQARIAELKALRAKKEISLREAVRLKERAEFEKRRLEMENAIRRARKQPPLASIDALKGLDEEHEEQEPEQKNDEEAKPMLVEGGYVLLDFVRLAGESVARH